MAHIFQKYRLQMIKESSTKYDLNNTISIPEDIEHMKFITLILLCLYIIMWAYGYSWGELYD